MSKIATSFLFFCLFSISINAQIFDPIKWEWKINSLPNGEYELVMKAILDEGWSTYSQNSSDEGPVPTEIQFKEGSHFTLIGKAEERGKKKEGPEPLFDNVIVAKYEGKVEFVQKVKVTDPTKHIQGFVTYMVCDKERCLPPTDKKFSFQIGTPAKSPGGSPIGMDAGSEDGGKEKKNEINVVNTSPTLEQTDSDPGGGLIVAATWNAKTEKLSDQTYRLIFEAKIIDEWHIYSNTITGEGPTPTTLQFDQKNKSYELFGKLSERSSVAIKEFDPNFEMDLLKFKKDAIFSQDIKILDPSQPVKGFIDYMSCNSSMCIPYQEGFLFDPQTATLTLQSSDKINTGFKVDGETIDQLIPNLYETKDKPVGDCGEEIIKGTNHIYTFLFGFLGGLIALLTPCVFPMIPLTVSFFTKGSKDRKSGVRNGILYGLSIILIYVGIGLLITAVFGATALNELSSSWIANLIFFIIFIFFAFSFFGYYEITLPSRWANKADSMADKGGLIGIFFMAFTLAIVSFSCTGPIIGSAIVESATSKIGPSIVMFGFALALALPFGLFAAFPAWLNSLPKSGSWMNSVKVVLGFAELALAFKFLSVSDMTKHWGILGYEIFLGLWILICIGMTLYLFGLIRFPHDSPIKNLSPVRWVFALSSLALTIYFLTGFTVNDKIKAYNSPGMLSGIAPPAHYNYFLAKGEVDPNIKSKYPSFTKCANNLDCFKDYYEGLAYAKEVNKPMLIDFTGHACTNCRNTEQNIWIQSDIWEMIQTKYVLVSLYVDDRIPLEKTYVSKHTELEINNVGRKWADFQIVNFKQNSQPLYILATAEEVVLAKPRGYKSNISDYEQFLNCGLEAFEKSKIN